MPADPRLFTLEAFLVGGPVEESFRKRNPVVSRTIEIRAGQTLEELHEALFAAFDRWDHHYYEFQVGGKGPMDLKSRRYTIHPADEGAGVLPAESGLVSRTSVGSLGLKVGDAFGYWFDFGDDWWHQVNVKAIAARSPRGRFPRPTARVGESPPQYPEEDEDEG